ncbi:phage antirepressor KilAC domain-containing protein [uncultured Phascolarctobacterium sp.]|uniref:phage antirepressor KilAC domain-containing protein n=1 Tax=uncultured Phascolarctobacterium sp. TaxID=512296 RepID=UPI0026157725|nr:phage antirepressor KilAC domain-containing protein [uncultured Phascolarctobacterium sp.]
MKLQLFENDQFKIRTMEYDGAPWFVGRDVAEILGYVNTNKAFYHVDEDDRFLAKISTSRGPRTTVAVNEAGVYSLIFGSKLPAARDFKRWICHEVLPSIRKHGAYLTDAKLADVQNNAAEMQQLTAALAEERQKHAQAQLLLCEKDDLIQRKNAYFERNKPRIEFAKAVFENRTAILVGEMAKLLAQNGIEIGQNRFFEWLRENGYLQRKEGNMRNIPYQKCIDAGIFLIKESTNISPKDGTVLITRTPMITGKGQRYFISKFLQTKDEEALAAISEEELKLAADKENAGLENNITNEEIKKPADETADLEPITETEEGDIFETLESIDACEGDTQLFELEAVGEAEGEAATTAATPPAAC